MNLIMTDIANLSVFLFPVVPTGTTISGNGSNNTDNTLDGKVRIMDNHDLRTFKWSSVFPVNKDYSFVNAGALKDGWKYVTFIELMRRFKLPVRIIGTTKNKVPIFNLLVTIDEFYYNVDKVGDINYTLSLTEFPEGFFDFIDRDIRVYKYVKKYLTQTDKLKKLKDKGLINFNNFKNRFN